MQSLISLPKRTKSRQINFFHDYIHVKLKHSNHYLQLLSSGNNYLQLQSSSISFYDSKFVQYLSTTSARGTIRKNIRSSSLQHYISVSSVSLNYQQYLLFPSIKYIFRKDHHHSVNRGVSNNICSCVPSYSIMLYRFVFVV